MTPRFPISLVLIAALFAGCAANIVDVPPPSGGGVSLYGWNLEKPVTYTTEQSSGTVKSSIALRFLAANTPGRYRVVETYQSQTDDTLELRSSADSLVVSGLTERSVIRVPSGYALNRDRFDTIKSYRTIAKIYAFGDAGQQIVAADDSSNIFYSSDAGSSWAKSYFPGGTAISVLDTISGFIYGPFVSSKPALCVATRNGYIYYSTNGGQTWTNGLGGSKHLNGSVANLCISNDAIYASVGSLGIYRLGPSPTQVTSLPPGLGPLTALAAMTFSGSRDPHLTLLAGRANSGFYYLDTAVSLQWQSPGIFRDFSNGTARFILRTADSSFVISVDGNAANSLLAWSPWRDTTIALSHLGATTLYTAAAIDESARHRIIMLAEDGSLATIQSPSYAPPGSLPALGHVTSVAIAGNTAFAATTDSGIFSCALPSATNWSPSLRGSPASERAIRIPVPLEFNLLALPPTGLAVGTTWTAGAIVVDSLHLSATVRADVVRYIDSLKLTNGLTFSKIFVVDYAIEDASHSVVHTPLRWTIYYAQGEGPILIDEVQEPSGILLSRAYRSSK